MKKLVWIGLLVGLVGLLAAGPARAVGLSFVPSSQTVPPGSSLAVDVVISGLGSPGDPSVGAFDLDVTYDPSVLTATGVAFGPFLGDPGLGEALTSSSLATAGVVDFAELSLLDNDIFTCFFCIPPFLSELQPASFTLATLDFDAVGAGLSPLAFDLASPNVVSDGLGIPLSVTAEGGSVTVTPEPATLLLLGGGLAGLGFVRRRGKLS